MLHNSESDFVGHLSNLSVATLVEKLSGHRNEVPIVVPLLPEHLDNMYISQSEAFEDDPLFLYLTNERGSIPPKGKPVYKRLWKTKNIQFLKHNTGLTINAGESNILVVPAESDKGTTPPGDIIKDYFSGLLIKAYLVIFYKHLRKRLNELELWLKTAIDQHLGDLARETVYIQVLATKPAAQGQGYASALLRTILFSADLRGHTTYLFSSNVKNNAFYESFGFKIVSQIELGKDDSTWKKAPVIVSMMVRKPGEKMLIT